MSKNISQNPNTIKLQTPFTTDAGVPVEQVTVKPLNVRQMKTAQKQGGGDDAETETIMIAMSCDLVVEDLDKMFLNDYMAVRERFQALNFNRTSGKLDETAIATR